MKRQRRHGTREERSSESTTNEFLGHRDALERIQKHQDQHSSDQRACGNYGRLAVSIHRNTAVRAGVNRERHRDCVHMRPEYFDGIQMLEDFPVMADLRWDDVKDVY